MKTFKTSILNWIMILICVSSVFIYNVPNNGLEWILNSLACVILGLSFILIAIKYLEH